LAFQQFHTPLTCQIWSRGCYPAHTSKGIAQRRSRNRGWGIWWLCHQWRQQMGSKMPSNTDTYSSLDSRSSHELPSKFEDSIPESWPHRISSNRLFWFQSKNFPWMSFRNNRCSPTCWWSSMWQYHLLPQHQKRHSDKILAVLRYRRLPGHYWE